MSLTIRPHTPGYSYVIGSCTGSSSLQYDFWLEYKINGTSLILNAYLQRNDDYINSYYNLNKTVNIYINCGSSSNTINNSVDTRESKLVLMHTATFNNAAGKIIISAGFSNTGSPNLSGGSVSTSITIGSAPTLASISLSGGITSGVAQGNITISINQSGAANGGTIQYMHQYHLDGSNTWINGGWTTSSTKTIKVPSATFPEGRTIYFKGIAKNNIGQTSTSEESVKINSSPTAPKNLFANATRPITSFIISWGASSDADNHHVFYELDCKKSTETDYSRMSNTTGTNSQIDITNDPPGTGYDFRVRARDSLGAVSGYIIYANQVFKATPPNMPTITMNKSGIAEGIVILTATSDCSYPLGATEYQFSYQCGSDAWVYPAYSTSNIYSINITDTEAKRGKLWKFNVRAKNNAGESGWAVLNEVITSNSRPIFTGTINVLTNYIYNNKISLSWPTATDTNNQTISYDLYVSKNNGAYSLVISDMSTTSYNYDITNDAIGTSYKFKVKALDSLGAFNELETTTLCYKSAIPIIDINSDVAEIAEKTITITAVCTNDYYPKDIEYYYEYKKGEDIWRVGFGGWIANNRAKYNLSTDRGITWHFRSKARTSAGESSYSNILSIISNSEPKILNSAPIITNPIIIRYINIIWEAGSDVDNQTLTYNLYMTTNSGISNKLITSNIAETSTSIDLNSVWPNRIEGNTMSIALEAIDSLGAVSSRISSNIYTIASPNLVESKSLGKIKINTPKGIKEIAYYDLTTLPQSHLRIKTHKGIGAFNVVPTTSNLASPIRIKSHKGIEAIAYLTEYEATLAPITKITVKPSSNTYYIDNYKELEIDAVAYWEPSYAPYYFTWTLRQGSNILQTISPSVNNTDNILMNVHPVYPGEVTLTCQDKNGAIGTATATLTPNKATSLSVELIAVYAAKKKGIISVKFNPGNSYTDIVLTASSPNIKISKNAALSNINREVFDFDYSVIINFSDTYTFVATDNIARISGFVEIPSAELKNGIPYIARPVKDSTTASNIAKYPTSMSHVNILAQETNANYVYVEGGSSSSIVTGTARYHINDADMYTILKDSKITKVQAFIQVMPSSSNSLNNNIYIRGPIPSTSQQYEIRCSEGAVWCNKNTILFDNMARPMTYAQLTASNHYVELECFSTGQFKLAYIYYHVYYDPVIPSEINITNISFPTSGIIAVGLSSAYNLTITPTNYTDTISTTWSFTSNGTFPMNKFTITAQTNTSVTVKAPTMPNEKATVAYKTIAKRADGTTRTFTGSCVFTSSNQM